MSVKRAGTAADLLSQQDVGSLFPAERCGGLQQPTDAVPASRAKVEEMALRAYRGQSLFMPRDRQIDVS